MSDEERDMDMDSEEDDMDEEDLMDRGSVSGSTKPMTQAEKRAHHNALERKRRDHIKDSFTSLRDSVPSLSGEKSSRAQILKKAADYIQFMRRKNSAHQHDIEDLKRQNNVLENQIRGIERAKITGSFSSATASMMDTDSGSLDDNSLQDEDEEDANNSGSLPGGTKKIKIVSVGTLLK